jgi:hydrogenase large subunit
MKIVINPVTRISGFMEIETYIENGTVVDAKTEGLLFRGFEIMLNGRPPMDAVYFTQRICGICSTAHSVASTLALEQAFGVEPSRQGRYLRDIIHGCEFLQNHIRHFYQYTVPDFILLPDYSPLFEANGRDFRLPREKNGLVARHYFDSLALSRNAHKMLAILGGKAPHNHGVFLGGATAQATADKIIAMKSILHDITGFLDSCMIPDAYLIAQYYGDYFSVGGGYGNMLSFGCFDGYEELGTLYVDPLVYINGQTSPFYPEGVTENTRYSYYSDTPGTYRPFDTITPDEPDKETAYSWVKAPRYCGYPCEVGPLARLWLAGEYRRGISAMDRTIARVLEARKIAGIIDTLLSSLVPGVSAQAQYEVPRSARGAGLIDTTRGALGHWLEISDGVISLYQIITPSAWNLSTRTSDSKGTGEKALIGTSIEDAENPVELGRIIRSFDPCVSCATHVYTQGNDVKTFRVVP